MPVHVLSTMRGPIIGLFLALQLVACSPPAPSEPTFAVAGRAVAGPVCPVEPANAVPGQCDPRPVTGATLIVTDGAGHEVATLTTGSDGTFTTSLPAGSYTLTPQPVAGLMGGAPPTPLEVSAGDHPMDLVIAYDTGIR
jgi:hypothetical protein